MPKYNWTRVLFPNGKYGYVKTDNNDKATEYKSDGTFKVYSQPNEKSHSFYTSFETRPRTIQRVPDDHEAHLALQRQVDEKVRQTTPSAGQLFNVATVGGLNNLSPTQWMRRAYDTGQLIQGHMPLNEYMNKLYYGNNGIVSDEYARKHPYRTMAANLIGDIATFGTASALRKMPSWYRAMLAENQMAQDIVADNWRNIGRGSVGYDVRTGPVAEEIPAEYMPKQITFIHPSEAVSPAVRGIRQYVRPVTNVNKYEFNIMSDGKSRPQVIKTSRPITVSGEAEDPIIYNTTRSGLPYVKSDLEALRTLLPTEHIYNGQVRRVYKLDGKLAMTELEYNALIDKFRPTLTEKEFNNPILSEEAKTELRKALKLHKKINKNYSEQIEDIKAQTKLDYGSPIDWGWYNQGILAESNIPALVATAPVFDPGAGKVIDSRPLMLRFYENVLKQDGIIQKTLKELIDNRILIPYKGLWVVNLGSDTNTVSLVDPTRFTLNYILQRMFKSPNRIEYKRLLDRLHTTSIPYHSTPIGDKSLTRIFADPTGKRPLFTSIDDGSEGFAPLRMAYKRTKFGTSIPVMTRDLPRTEEYYLISNNGLHGSNNFGEVGELYSHFTRNGGKPLIVVDVSDARNIKGNTGQRQNEFNFGTGTPNVGFIVNTYDFERPASVAGPFLGYKNGGKVKIKRKITVTK